LLSLFYPAHIYDEFNLDDLSYRKINEEDFVDLCNKYNIIVVCGLIIFNGQKHYDRTGAKIDISIQHLKSIKSKFILLGVSSRIWDNDNYHHQDKLKDFVDFINNSPNWSLVFRQDGSKHALEEMLRIQIPSKEIVDPAMWAFKTESQKLIHPETGKLFINLNGEDAKYRYPTGFNKLINFLAENVNEILEDNHFSGLVLQPHGPDDLLILSELANRINNYSRHRFLEFGSLSTHQDWISVYNRYKFEAKFIITMRIHSMNPASIMGIPLFVISSSRRIHSFCERYLDPKNFTNLDSLPRSHPFQLPLYDPNVVKSKIKIDMNKSESILDGIL
jgi:polysaccharide pyruvyl transferase WcaK-like protein